MYELKCKAIALAVEAKAFKQQEQREKRLLDKWKRKAAAAIAKAVGRGETPLGPNPNSAYSPTLRGIHLHRVNEIRKEARCALLAYGFVRGKSYQSMENFAWTQPNWDRVEKLAIRYSDTIEQDVKQRFAQWRDEGLGGVKARWIETIQPGSIKGPVLSFSGGFDNHDWVHMQTARNLGVQDTQAVA